MNELNGQDAIFACAATDAALIDEDEIIPQSILSHSSIATAKQVLNESHTEDAIFDAAAALIDEVDKSS